MPRIKDILTNLGDRISNEVDSGPLEEAVMDCHL